VRWIPSERLELIATVLLALATVGTAWSGYQASRWNGEQAKAAGRATGLRIESGKEAGRADALSQIDVATFTSWVDAFALEQKELADFYFKRFRPEFKRAVVAWVKTRPRHNPNAPLTPFAMPQYRLEARDNANRLAAEGDSWAAVARRNVERSTNYVLGVVLFAAALFFAAMSTKLRSPRLRLFTLGVGVVVFLATVVWLATSPVSVSV
jgi:hypothetical protein